MSFIGGKSPLPYAVGGGPSSTEQLYDALKQMVGKGGSADEQTIESEWRLAKARTVAAGEAMVRALYQGIPPLSTSFIPVWEIVLGILTNEALSDEERRQTITDRLAGQIEANTPDLTTQLQEIDPLFSILPAQSDPARVTVSARAFEDFDPDDSEAAGPAFGGGRTFTSFPNFSDWFICVVQYTIPSGTLTGEQANRISRAKELLNEVLPAWVDYRIISDVGFILDQSLLDIGAFGS